MKVLAIVLALCLVSCYASTLSDEQKAKLKTYKEKCITESSVDPEVVAAILKGGKITREEKLDKFSSCFLKELKFQKEDGSIDTQAVVDLAKTTNADITKVNEVIEKCKDLKGDNANDTAGKVFTCFIENKTFPVLD